MNRRIAGPALAIAAAATLAACTANTSMDSRLDSQQPVTSCLVTEEIPSTGPVPKGCVRTEGAELGGDATLQLNGARVTFTGWTKKTGEGEFAGFTFTSTGGAVGYAVKAGGETFRGTSTTWVNPNGVSGSAVSGISNITFCPVSEPGAGTPDGGSPEGGTPASAPPSCGQPPAGGGSPCTSDAQCASNQCTNGLCEAVPPPGGNGAPCSVNAQCLSNACSDGLCEGGGKGGDGARCTSNDQCSSAACEAGFCEGGVATPPASGPPFPEGGAARAPCSVPSDCYTGTCTAGFCEGSGAGGGCRSQADCNTGLSCENSKCVSPLN
jgi:hypothetical protein